MTGKIGVVINASAGNKTAGKKQIQAAFGKHKDLVFFNIKDGVESLEKSVAKHKIKRIVAAGGDGTVNGVAQVAINLGIPLGVLPLGTFNHFAKDLGLPLDIEQAAKIAGDGRLTKIDYCTVNGHIFLNNSSVGLYPSSVRRRNKMKWKTGKWLAVLLSFFGTLLRINALSLNLQIHGKERHFKTPLVFVGNNSYEYTKIGFTNRTSLSSGKLFVYVVRSNKILSLVSTTFYFFLGMQKADKNYMKLTSKTVVLSPKKKQLHTSVDGEIISQATPLVYEVHPTGLIVCVP